MTGSLRAGAHVSGIRVSEKGRGTLNCAANRPLRLLLRV